MTRNDFAKIQADRLAQDDKRRARQKLSLVFSYLQGEDRVAYKKHTEANGTSLESLETFWNILLASFLKNCNTDLKRR